MVANGGKSRVVRRPSDTRSIEERVRQLLADKVSGTMVGLWLLVPEHLRLGTWDLLRGWAGASPDSAASRVAMQMVHEAALCIRGHRDQRSLTQSDFELLNGLGFSASDGAVHDLLDSHDIAHSQATQVALGRIRRSLGHFQGSLLAIDPHRLTSYSKRQMRRWKPAVGERSTKILQTFFCLDAVTAEPVCMTIGSAGSSVSAVTPTLLKMAEAILGPARERTLVLADAEHFTGELFDYVKRQGRFDLLTPMPGHQGIRDKARSLSEESFHRCWAGLAMAKVPYSPVHSQAGPYQMIVQRCGEQPQSYWRKCFLCTSDRPEVSLLTEDFPRRWNIEEFFNIHQSLGWRQAGTQNLHIRYGRMTMALIAQAALTELRKRLEPQQRCWNAEQFATKVLRGLQGDIRLQGDRLVVTYYNAEALENCRQHFEHLPEQLTQQGIDPRVPWLYNYPLDFRFK